MIVGIIQVELAIPDAASLKDKRSVVRSLKDHLRRDLRLAAAEVAHQDDPSLASLGACVITSDGRKAGQVLDKARELCRREHRAEIVSNRRWIVRVKDLIESETSEEGSVDETALADEMLNYVARAGITASDAMPRGDQP